MLESIKAIYRTNLGVKNNEVVFVFTDTPSKKETISPEEVQRRQKLRDIALLVSEVGRGFAKKVLYLEYPATGSHAKEPPKKLWEVAFGKKAVDRLQAKGLFKKILRKTISDDELKEASSIVSRFREDSVDCIIALSNYSTSHTIFRNLLTGGCGVRYASMPLFEPKMFEGSMNVDWKALQKRTSLISKEVSEAEYIEISTPNGTHLRLSKRARKVFQDSGNLRKKGSFGNLPAGEVFLAPTEGSSEGRLVLEWAPTRQLNSPITLIVKGGSVVDILGNEPYADFLKEKLSERAENSNIAELGIGTNDMAKRPDNILESEKILGTIHIALGDNSSFGGRVKTPFHQDFVFFRPTLVLIDRTGRKKKLIDKGVLIYER